jgi:hypothetical protein
MKNVLRSPLLSVVFVSVTLLTGCEKRFFGPSEMKIRTQSYRLNNMDVINEYDGRWTKIFLTAEGISFVNMYNMNLRNGSTGLYFYLPTKTLTVGTYKNDRIRNEITVTTFVNYESFGGHLGDLAGFDSGEVSVSEKNGIYMITLNNFIEPLGSDQSDRTKLTVSFNGTPRFWE